MLWGLSLLQGLAILGCCRGWKYQRDDRDASVAPLGDGLLVGPSVGHDQDAGLEESSLDLISACGERTSDGAAAGIPGEKHIC